MLAADRAPDRGRGHVHNWLGRSYVGGDECIGSPDIDGWFADDVYGLGAPGSPDATPIVKESGLPPAEVVSGKV